MPDSVIQGTVQEFDAERGYGRIVDAQERMFFVHFRDLQDGQTLHAGQTVEFKAILHRKGNIAQEVRGL